MRPTEKTDCPSCKQPVLLSFVPTRDETLQDHWTCPHDGCRIRHLSPRKGTVVVATRSTDPLN